MTDYIHKEHSTLNDTFLQKLQKGIRLGELRTGEMLSGHTSFRVGGPADYFVLPGSEEELFYAISLARKENYPCFVIGKGTNLLVSDAGFRGLIIKMGKGFQEISVDGCEIVAQAGALLGNVSKAALEHGLAGLAFAAGIPGSVGGGVAMNAGAYGGEMKDVIVSADVMTGEGKVLTLTKDELDLSYRHSCIFEKGYIVLSVRLELTPGDPEQIRAEMERLALARREKQPLEYPSAGSTFKRPEGYFAGKLIQDAGLSGYTVGGAQVSEKHRGFVINRGNATAEEIAFLIRQVQKKVKAHDGVDLETEVRFVGFPEKMPEQ